MNKKTKLDQKLMISILLFLLLFSCSKPNRHITTTQKGHLHIKESIKDFGHISRRKKMEAFTYIIMNTGIKPITIFSIDVSCGCLTISKNWKYRCKDKKRKHQ